jgi:hypothetical protein
MSNNSLSKYEVFLDKTAENIACFLGEYLVHIEDHYDWSFNTDMVPRCIDFDFDSLRNWYEKTVRLKSLIAEQINSYQNFDERFPLGEYFVATWGGVGTNKKLKEKLLEYDQVNDFNNIKTLAGVSSWSKYLSLRNSEAAIYDSRVAYAINAINYLKDYTDNFFPLPEGRSPKLNLLDLETLFLLSKLREHDEFISKEDKTHRHIASRIKKRYYLPEEITYRAYLELLNRAAKILCLSNDEKYKIEMLLFALAPTIVFNALINNEMKPQRGENN